MNKAEKKRMEELERALKVARALRWSDPAPKGTIARGSQPVRRGWVASYSTLTPTEIQDESSERTRSRWGARADPLHETRLGALLETRNHIEEIFAETLFHIDEAIEKERASPTPLPPEKP